MFFKNKFQLNDEQIEMLMQIKRNTNLRSYQLLDFCIRYTYSKIDTNKNQEDISLSPRG